MAQALGYQTIPVHAVNHPVAIPVPAQTAANIAMVPKPREKYKMVLFKLGITEIVLGSLSCFFAVIAIAVAPGYRYGLTAVAQGIWCGAFIITSGILGLKAKSYPSICMYNANMALSIIASVFMAILVIMSGIAATVSYYPSTLAFHIIIAVIGFVGMVITIIHSSYCCAGICCRGYNQYPGSVVYMPQNQYVQQPQQLVQLANGQYMLVQSQHPMTSISVNGPPMTYQPGLNPQQQAPQPSTSTYPQGPYHTKEQESHMQEGMESPPEYGLLPSNQG